MAAVSCHMVPVSGLTVAVAGCRPPAAGPGHMLISWRFTARVGENPPLAGTNAMMGCQLGNSGTSLAESSRL